MSAGRALPGLVHLAAGGPLHRLDTGLGVQAQLVRLGSGVRAQLGRRGGGLVHPLRLGVFPDGGGLVVGVGEDLLGLLARCGQRRGRAVCGPGAVGSGRAHGVGLQPLDRLPALTPRCGLGPGVRVAGDGAHQQNGHLLGREVLARQPVGRARVAELRAGPGGQGTGGQVAVLDVQVA